MYIDKLVPALIFWLYHNLPLNYNYTAPFPLIHPYMSTYPPAGVFGLPHCPGDSSICEFVRKQLNWGAYIP